MGNAWGNDGAALRYAAYAVALAVGAVFYWQLGEPTTSAPVSRASARTDTDMLPVLRSLDGSGDSATRRDLFAYAEPERAPMVEAPAPPPPAPVDTPAPQPSQLDEINVVGLVRRNNSLFVFIQSGGAIRTVALGGKFGEGNALTIRSVQGREVTVVDTVTNSAKVFTLSEE